MVLNTTYTTYHNRAQKRFNNKRKQSTRLDKTVNQLALSLWARARAYPTSAMAGLCDLQKFGVFFGGEGRRVSGDEP